MGRSYVGIVTDRGLVALFPEEDVVVRFLHRRVYRRRPYLGICCWAVLSAEAVDKIEHQLAVGENQNASYTLQSEATYWGPILPSESDEIRTYADHTIGT